MKNKDFYNMYCKPLKELLNLVKKMKNIELCADGVDKKKYKEESKKIKELFDATLRDITEKKEINDYILYFDAIAVDEPYDGLEFKDDEEEFYYYNSESKLVFMDTDGELKICFKIRNLKQFNIDYEKVCTVVKYAIETTKRSQMHPLKSAWLSSYDLRKK